MGIMVPILMFGAVFTMLMPVTDRQSLEILVLNNNSSNSYTDSNSKNVNEYTTYCENIDIDVISKEVDNSIDQNEAMLSSSFTPRNISIPDDKNEKVTAARRAAALSRAEVTILEFLFLLVNWKNGWLSASLIDWQKCTQTD